MAELRKLAWKDQIGKMQDWLVAGRRAGLVYSGKIWQLGKIFVSLPSLTNVLSTESIVIDYLHVCLKK